MSYESIKCIFTSFGFYSPIVSEKVARILPQGDNLLEKTCFVIPYAGFNIENTFEREKKGLVGFGLNPEKVVFAQSWRDFEEQTPDYIYVPGGDPFKLLKLVRQNGMIEKIRKCVLDKQSVYIGVSAGVDIATENIEYVMQLEDNNEIDEIKDESFKALNLIEECIICHYDHYSYATLKKCKEISKKNVKTINDNQVLLFENGNWTYI